MNRCINIEDIKQGCYEHLLAGEFDHLTEMGRFPGKQIGETDARKKKMTPVC